MNDEQSADHQAIEEGLAGYALHALDEDEAVQVEALLADHLPGCASCRDLLDRFRAITGDLALAASPSRPPRMLGVRLRRELRTPRTPIWARTAAVAVTVALVAGLGTWTAHLSHRVNEAEQRQVRTTEVLATVSHPQSHVVTLSADRIAPAVPVSLAVAYIPGRPRLYLFGSMPNPSGDRVYQVWLVKGGRFASVGTFLPERGVVLIRIEVDAQGYDGLLITEEPARGSATPSSRHVVRASL